jgi:hypothetical protein
MLKQIGVRLEEELIKKVKMLAIEEGISVQDVFKTVLESYFDNKLTNKQDNKITSKNDNKLTSEQVKKTTKKKPEPEPVIVDGEEYVPMEVIVDEDMDWQPPTTQDFYGKFEPPAYLKPGEFDHDPLKYLDPIEETTTIKPKKVIDEDDNWKAF